MILSSEKQIRNRQEVEASITSRDGAVKGITELGV